MVPKAWGKPASLGGEMEIHKPKSFRGWREFAKEVGTIVIGVLIALGAEQIVQSLHEARLSREAREAVRSELNIDLTNVSRRAEVQACIDRRIGEIGNLLDKAERGAPFQPATLIGAPITWTVATQRWQAATAGGRTSLLSSEEQGDLARVYAQLTGLREDEAVEAGAWSRLGAIQDERSLSPMMVFGARQALAEVRAKNFEIQNSLDQIRRYAARVGVRGDAKLVSFDPGSHVPLCLPITMSRTDAQRLLKTPHLLP